MSERLILHEYAASGNCYKVRLTAAATNATSTAGMSTWLATKTASILSSFTSSSSDG
mgnify:CR=1 FL=1